MVQHGAALARESGDASLAARSPPEDSKNSTSALAALCRYGVKLTLTPHQMQRTDIDELRLLGFNDRAIVDANQVVSYFNYVNRVADGLGVELEASWPEDMRRPRTYPLAP